MAIRAIRGLKVVECDTLAEANSHSREVGDIVIVAGQKIEDKFGSRFSETVAAPTATQGFVNLGTPVWTGGVFSGIKSMVKNDYRILTKPTFRGSKCGWGYDK